jgi:AcrR family transcriptional regulator
LLNFWGDYPIRTDAASNLTAMTDPDSECPTIRGRTTRDRIVTCTTELVLSNGFDGFSIDNVRRAASVSGSQMSHYFASRDALIRAVIARQTQVVLDFHHQRALGDLDTFDDFDRWAELTLRFGRRRPRSGQIPTFGALVRELGRNDQRTRELLADGYRQWGELLVAGLQRMKDRGALVAEADTAQLASVLMSAHQSVGPLSVAFCRPWPDREALTFALKYLRMFAADPAERIKDVLPQANRQHRS